MKKLIIIFSQASCASPNSNIRSNSTKMNFDVDLIFDELNKLLIQYTKKNLPPNLDQ